MSSFILLTQNDEVALGQLREIINLSMNVEHSLY